MKRKAVYTMVYNEAIFLPIWLRYYSQFFDAEDIYVLDHSSIDGSTDGKGFTRTIFKNSGVDCAEQLKIVQSTQHELLTGYELVLYSDVDEFVVPDPRNGTLGDYLDAFQYDFVTCNGYELLHLIEEEPSLDLSKPVMPQRQYWFANPKYMSKPLLSKVQLKWDLGCHSCANGSNKDDSLYLIHLHRADFDICWNRHSVIAAKEHSQQDISNGWGDHRRITDQEYFKHWFYHDSGALANKELIPDYWKVL